MKNSTPDIAISVLKNVRRRSGAVASAAAALAFSGCGMLGGQHPQAQVSPDSTLSPAAQQAQDRVRAFTAGLDEALAKIDRDKLRGMPSEKVPEDAAVTPPVKDAAAPVVAAAAFNPEPALPESLQIHLDGAVPTIGPALSPTSSGLAPRGEFSLEDLAHPDWVAPPLALPVAAAGEPAAIAGLMQPSIDSAMEILRAKVAAHPTLNTALALALLERDQGRTLDPAVGRDLSANDQKLLADLTGALAGMNAPTPMATLNDRALPLLEAAKKWQADADLTLPKLALASRVDSYGVYTKLEPKFIAGKKETVIIYCEVANFVPKKTADGWYETKLAQQETLVTDDGLLLWRPNAEEVEDRSTNQRHDFYLVKKLTIPDKLAVGKYALRMSVTDHNTGKIAVVSLPIEIVK